MFMMLFYHKTIVLAAFGSKVRNAPSEMDDVEPEALGDAWVGAGPGFEGLIGGLPISPNGRRRTDGAGLGAEIIDVERGFVIGDFSRGVGEVIKYEFGVLCKIEFWVKGKVVFSND